MPGKMTRRGSLAATVGLMALREAGAQEAWPTRPVRIIVPYAPGGTTDIVARMVAERLSPSLGQPMPVENRPGGGAVIGSEMVARATDGHTLLMATNGSHAINVALMQTLSYDPLRDFTPITIVASVPLVLVVPSSLPITSVEALTAYIRARPGQVSFGSAGIGASGHLAGEMFKYAARLDMVHVPYRGDASLLPDLMAGRHVMAFANLPGAIGQVRAGTLRALAVTTEARSAALPDVPTMREAGMADFVVDPWYGLMAPAGMPPARAARLQSLIAAALTEAEVRDQLTRLGAQPIGNTPDAFAAALRADIDRYVAIQRAVNLERS